MCKTERIQFMWVKTVSQIKTVKNVKKYDVFTFIEEKRVYLNHYLFLTVRISLVSASHKTEWILNINNA